MPFKAVSDPTRREILELLAERPRSVQEIAELFPVSRPAISKHLRLLREAGLAVERKEGRRRFYSLQSEPLREVEEWTRAVAQKASTQQGPASPGRTGSSGKPRRRSAPAGKARRSAREGAAAGAVGPVRTPPAGTPTGDDADDWHVW